MRYGIVIALVAAFILFGRGIARGQEQTELFLRGDAPCKNGVCPMPASKAPAVAPAQKMPVGCGPSVAYPCECHHPVRELAHHVKEGIQERHQRRQARRACR